MSICTNNSKPYTETVYHSKGNPISDQILDKYLSNEQITMNNLKWMENMIRYNNETKPELLAIKTDFKVEKIVNLTEDGPLHTQSVIVLNLLRDTKIEEGNDENEQIEDEQEEENPNDEARKQRDDNNRERALTSVPKNEDINSLIPFDVQKFLRKGQILTVFREDRKERSMHFFLSNDFADMKCKRPKDNFVKQKWIIPIHQVKEIRKGYTKDSPIPKSGGFFRKVPPSERCFAVFGPIKFEEPMNFHFVCEEPRQAENWFNYLTMVVSEYKKIVAANLKKAKKDQ